jgi:signal transduction histidine kinase
LGKALLLFAAALALLTALVAAGYRASGQPVAWTLLRVVAGTVAYAGAGVVAWWRRPSNRMGQIMLLGAIIWLLSALVGVSGPVLVAVGMITRILPFAVVVHLLLAFPSGRLRTAPARWTVAASYAVSLLLQAPSYLSAPGSTLAERFSAAALARSAVPGWTPLVIAGSVVDLVAAGILVVRLRRAGGRRWAIAPLYLYGVFAAVGVPVLPELIAPVAGLSATAIRDVQVLLLIGVPVAFTAAMLFGGFARAGEIQELGVWLGSTAGSRASLQQALASALGDESVRLAYWIPEQSGYADAAGEPVTLPGRQSGRASVEVQVGDRLVGAIVYDAALIGNPRLVRMASRVIALAVDHERLTAELAASHRQILLSRERIVQAGDRERRRIAQNLHDGLQADLVMLSVEAQRLADHALSPATVVAAEELRGRIDRTAAGLRDLVYQVMPAPLIERGLGAATEDLIDRAPIPTKLVMRVDGDLSEALQSTAYFVVAEGLNNAVKHSHARGITVEIASRAGGLQVRVKDDGIGGARINGGLGLTGMSDRVAVLGGSLRVDSPPGGGTEVVADMPAAS